MIKAISFAVLSLVLSFFVAVTAVNAQTATSTPTMTPTPTATQNTPGAPSTGFGY